MEWEIISFKQMWPIRFGMTSDEVASTVGLPERARRGLRPGTFNEFRGIEAPIVRYNENGVRKIEAFYDLGTVSFRGIDLFRTDGVAVLRQLQELNGGAKLSVGIILFHMLGVTTGRLDEGSRSGHSVTAFAPGTWSSKMDDFENISFA